MIHRRKLVPPLFYAAQDLVSASPSNFYVRLNAVLGERWEDLAAPLRPAFSLRQGRPSDPVVYLKCYLISYFENISYDTDLAERISDSISLRSFLGYTLQEDTPDHSSLSRVRAHVGAHCALEEVLEKVVAVCIEAGLVGGKAAAVAASLLPANAALSSLRSLRTGQSVRQHLQEVWARNRAREEGQAKEPVSISNADFTSGTDPDAKIARKPGTRRGLYYRVTHVTDEQAQIILAAEAGLADQGEAEAAKAPLTQAQETLQEHELSLGAVLGDAGYDDADLHAHIEELQAVALTHLQREGTKKPAGFRKSDFQYLPEQDCYRCPTGRLLTRSKSDRKQILYRAQVPDCAACPHRKPCVGDTKAGCRSIRRGPNEASRERTRARVATEPGRTLLKRRGQIVEAPFGHHKTYGGLPRVNCRGRTKVRVKVLMAAVAWNLIKLVNALRPLPARPRAPRLTHLLWTIMTALYLPRSSTRLRQQLLLR
jgi:transposase